MLRRLGFGGIFVGILLANEMRMRMRNAWRGQAVAGTVTATAGARRSWPRGG